MRTNDYINRFMFDNTDIRGEIVSSETAFQRSFAHQRIPAPLLPLFGEFLAGACLLSEVLKFEGTLTLQARGQGDVVLIMAETNHLGHFRGIVRLRPELDPAQCHFEDLDLRHLLGEGILTITIDPERGKRYQGIVPLQESTLGESLESYFRQSEQLPTFVRLFATDSHFGGVFLQCLPKQLIKDEEQRAAQWETCIQLANTVTAEEMFTLANEEVLLRLFHELQCRVFDPKALCFNCNCDRERCAGALRSIGYEDAVALLRERGVIGVDCQFCGKEYRFDLKDLAEVFPAQGGSLH